MNAADFQAWSDAVLNRVESALSDWVPAAAPAGLGEAMRYGVLDGGKRLRALLVQAAAEATGACADAVGAEAALRAASSLRSQASSVSCGVLPYICTSKIIPQSAKATT